MKPPTVTVMHKLGLLPDPWQVAVLESTHPRLLLNCCRQAGKSTTVAILALVEAIFVPGTHVLLLSRSHRQSRELFRTLTDFYVRLGSQLEERRTLNELELSNHSRIVCLPCNEETIRGYAGVTLMIIDEAARVPDDLYRAVRPMLAVSAGRLICLSTPYGKRGFFWECWAKGGDDWLRIEVPADRIPRIPPAFLEAERRGLGESWFRQEYFCSFESLEGLVYPDFSRCVVSAPASLGSLASLPSLPADHPPPRAGRLVGGIDFGFRNPFAAVWGTLDRDDVLWLTGEHYIRGKTLSHHADHLPRSVQWYCDPSGAAERAELLRAGFKVHQGMNAIRPGIAAVTARLESGRLKVLESRCPNLLYEAQLYRYGDSSSDDGPETPVAEHNHALDALRYLIATLDTGRQAPRPASPPPPPERPPTIWDLMKDDSLWTRIV